MSRIKDTDLLNLLSGNLSDEGLNSLADALASDPEAREMLSSQMDIVYNRLESEDITADLNNEARRAVAESMLRRIKRRRLWRTLTLAASLTLLFSLATAIMWHHTRVPEILPEDYASLVVEEGEQPVHMFFHDGTHVTLNAGSTLRYPAHFSSDSRKVCLSGEAYFSVAHDSDRPFTVDLGHSTVCVKGTSFNVKNYSGDRTATVTLDEGAVDIVHADTHYELHPQQSAIYDYEAGTVSIIDRGTGAARSSLWRNNVIAFDKTSLDEVLATLSRRYGVDFELADSTVCSHTFTFTSTAMPLDSILRDLEAISYLKFTKNGNTVRIYSTK